MSFAAGASISPPNALISPAEALISPHEAFISPHEASISPHEAFISPHEASISPHEAFISPHEASISPHEAFINPHEASISPHDAFINPHVALISPHEAFISPHEALISPHEALNNPLEASIKRIPRRAHLCKNKDRELTRKEILDDLHLDMSDEELELKLEALVKADIISQGQTNYDYRGVQDNIFDKVFRGGYEKEIHHFDLKVIGQGYRQLLEELN